MFLAIYGFSPNLGQKDIKLLISRATGLEDILVDEPVLQGRELRVTVCCASSADGQRLASVLDDYELAGSRLRVAFMRRGNFDHPPTSRHVEPERAERSHGRQTQDRWAAEPINAASGLNRMPISQDKILYTPQHEQFVPQNAQFVPQNAQFAPHNAQLVRQHAQLAPQQHQFAPQQHWMAPQHQIEPEHQVFTPKQQVYAPDQQHIPQTTGKWKSNTFQPVDSTKNIENQERLQYSTHVGYGDQRREPHLKSNKESHPRLDKDVSYGYGDQRREPHLQYDNELDLRLDRDGSYGYVDQRRESRLKPNNESYSRLDRDDSYGHGDQRREPYLKSNNESHPRLDRDGSYDESDDLRKYLNSKDEVRNPFIVYGQQRLETVKSSRKSRYDDYMEKKDTGRSILDPHPLDDDVDKAATGRSILEPHRRDRSVESTGYQNRDKPRQIFINADRIVTYEPDDQPSRSSSRISQHDYVHYRKRKYSSSSDDDEHRRMTRPASYKYEPTKITYNAHSYNFDKHREIIRRSRESDHYSENARSEKARGRSRENKSNSRERVIKQSTISEKLPPLRLPINSFEKSLDARKNQQMVEFMSNNEFTTKIPRERDIINYSNVVEGDRLDEYHPINDERKRARISENEISIRHKEIDDECNIIREQLEDYYKNIAKRGRYSERKQYESAEVEYALRERHSPIKEWTKNDVRTERSGERSPEYTDTCNINHPKSISSQREYKEHPVYKKQRLDEPSTSNSSAYQADTTVQAHEKQKMCDKGALLPNPEIVNTEVRGIPKSTGPAQIHEGGKPKLLEIPIEKIITPETMDTPIEDILKANPAIELTFRKHISADKMALHLLSRVLANKHIRLDNVRDKKFQLFLIQAYLSPVHSLFKGVEAAKLTMRQLENRYKLEDRTKYHPNWLTHFAKRYAFLNRENKSFDSMDFWRQVNRCQRPNLAETTVALAYGRTLTVTYHELELRRKAIETLLWEIFYSFGDECKSFQQIARSILREKLHSALGSSGPWMGHKRQVMSVFQATQPRDWVRAYVDECKDAYRNVTDTRGIRQESIIGEAIRVKDKVGMEHTISNAESHARAKATHELLLEVYRCFYELPKLFQSTAKSTLLEMMHGTLTTSCHRDWHQVLQEYKSRLPPTWLQGLRKAIFTAFHKSAGLRHITKERFFKALRVACDGAAPYTLASTEGAEAEVKEEIRAKQVQATDALLSDVIPNLDEYPEQFRQVAKSLLLARMTSEIPPPSPAVEAPILAREFVTLQPPHWQKKYLRTCKKEFLEQYEASIETRSRFNETLKKTFESMRNDATDVVDDEDKEAPIGKSNAVVETTSSENPATDNQNSSLVKRKRIRIRRKIKNLSIPEANIVEPVENAPQTQDEATRIMAGPSQAKAERPQNKVAQVSKVEQPLSKAGQSQYQAGQAHSKVDQPQNKAGQSQSKAGQSQSEAKQPQSKAEQPQSKAKINQSKAGQLQSEAVQSQSTTGQAHSKAEQPQSKTEKPQSKIEQPQTNNSQSQTIKINKLSSEAMERLNEASDMKTAAKNETISSGNNMVVAIYRKNGAKIDAALASLIRKRLVTIIDMANEQGIHEPNCKILNTHLDPKGIFFIRVGDEKAREWLLGQDFQLIKDIPLMVRRAGCVSLKIWLPGIKHSSNPLEQLAWQNSNRLKISQWRLRSSVPSQNGVTINVVAPGTAIYTWGDRPIVLFYQATKVTAKILEDIFDDDFPNAESLETEYIKQETVETEIVNDQTAEVTEAMEAIPANVKYEILEQEIEAVAENDTANKTAKQIVNDTASETTTVHEPAVLTTPVNETKGPETSIPDNVQSDTTNLETNEFESVVHTSAVSGIAVPDTLAPEIETSLTLKSEISEAETVTVSNETISPAFETSATLSDQVVKGSIGEMNKETLDASENTEIVNEGPKPLSQ